MSEEHSLAPDVARLPSLEVLPQTFPLQILRGSTHNFTAYKTVRGSQGRTKTNIFKVATDFESLQFWDLMDAQ